MSQVPTWVSQVPTWVSRVPTWVSLVPTWVSRVPTWVSRVPTWVSRIFQILPKTLTVERDFPRKLVRFEGLEASQADLHDPFEYMTPLSAGNLNRSHVFRVYETTLVNRWCRI